MILDQNAWIEKFRTFEKSLNGQSGQPIHQVRKAAILHFEQIDLPTSSDEAWKSVNTSVLAQTDYSLSRAYVDGSLQPRVLASLTLPDTIRLVFVNGFFAKDRSVLSGLPSGVRAGSLSDALMCNPAAVAAQIDHVVGSEQQTYTALNTAFLQDGVYVHIDKNTVCERPIHAIFYSEAGDVPTVAHTRNLLVAEDNSQVTFIETYAGEEGLSYLTNSVTEFVAGDNAQVDHYKLELESLQAIHIANHHARLGRGANVSSHSFSLGGAFVRNDVSSLLAGEGCEATVNGLYLLEGNQHIDNYTLLEHAEPQCPSHELYKGILGDQARAIFRGKIHVHKKAQRTDAYQRNENILLSDDARINAKPQLEIYADDVKCSHGATIGQLNQEALFYLRARGISETDAKNMLLKAFAGDVVDRVKVDALRAQLEAFIDAKFDRLYHVGEMK
jgi:Fe-S cluster assembly protein SufD